MPLGEAFFHKPTHTKSCPPLSTPKVMAWFPKNKYCWDFWFAWDEMDQLHLFYLQASQLDCRYNPNLRHDRASIGHAIMTSWGWQEVSPDLPAFDRNLQTPNAWDDLSIWTGSIIHNPQDQLYYLFYTSRAKQDGIRWTPHEWQRSQGIGIATSKDLYDWHRLEPNSLRIPAPIGDSRFDGVNWRDPYVIYNEADRRYYAFICAHGQAPDAGGIIAYVTSEDLHYWSAPEILLQSDDIYQMEVPQIFWRALGDGTKRCYMVFCAQDKDFSREWRDRRIDRPKTGSYYFISEPIPVDAPIDYTNLNWSTEAHLLTDEYYSGKVLWRYRNLAEAVVLPADAIVKFYGFQWGDESDQFVGGVSDPMAVVFEPDGRMSIVENKQLCSIYDRVPQSVFPVVEAAPKMVVQLQQT
jgi:beta-fructofuranosidase